MTSTRLHNFLFLLILVITIFCFTFKLLQIPPGLETDEGSISYNSILISQNLRDQNKRLLPFFILSSDHIDWKQPVLIYSSAILFKIFGASLTAFKLVNVLYSLGASILIYFIARLLIKEKFYALIAMVFYAISPIIISTTRIGNESILPAVFGSLWLLLVTIYYKKNQNIYLFLCALALGIGFYSFKGMRIIIPVWSMLTIFLIAIKNKLSVTSIKPIIIFGLTMAPFALIIPFLESKYPGAIFDRSSIPIEGYRYYLHYWLANINLYALFSEPDIGKIYEMKYFGAMLVSTMPLLILGLYALTIKTKLHRFILAVFFLTPMLFGIAKSTEYSHRLVSLVPLYALISTFGVRHIVVSKHFKYKRLSLILLTLFITFNSLDFFNYYFFVYPKQLSTQKAFSNNYFPLFLELSKESKAKNLEPYIQSDLYFGHNDANLFYEQAYFKKPLNIWKLGDPMPTNSILLTQVSHLDDAVTLKNISSSPDSYLLVSP
ncbi:MAG: glycosyltransferase family 39 protein [Candidatus Shapirobacteria bacterium]